MLPPLGSHDPKHLTVTTPKQEVATSEAGRKTASSCRVSCPSFLPVSCFSSGSSTPARPTSFSRGYLHQLCTDQDFNVSLEKNVLPFPQQKELHHQQQFERTTGPGHPGIQVSWKQVTGTRPLQMSHQTAGKRAGKATFRWEASLMSRSWIIWGRLIS